MFKKLTDKKWFFTAALLIGLWLCWQLAIKKTYLEWAECRTLQLQMSQAKTLPSTIDSLRKLMAKTDRQIGANTSPSSNRREQAFAIAGQLCAQYHLKLCNVEGPFLNRNNDMTLYTNTFTVEGDFKNILLTVQQIEKKKEAGTMASLRYYVKENLLTHERNLYADIYIQYLQKNLNTK